MLSERAFRDQLVTQGQRELYDYWRETAGFRALPARSDINPFSVPKLLPCIGLIDLTEGLAEAQFRLAGTRLRDVYGEEITGKRVKVEVEEITQPDLESQLVAENIADQIERRISHSRAMKRAIGQAMRQGAQGIKIAVAGRLGGSEMSRREWQREGRVPLQTLRADIDFAKSEALTTFGRIGVKVWIYKGEKMPEEIEVPEATDVYVSE